MRAAEIATLTAVEDRHWWYRERRALLARAQRDLPRGGVALDVGAAGGGNTRVLAENGWRCAAVEYGQTGADVCRSRGLPVLRADATQLPVASASCDLVVAFDLIEHIQRDDLAVSEFRRVLKPDATLLIAVPADPKLWSAHDVAVDHVRRYTRQTLHDVIADNGFHISDMRSWNVLLKPVAKLRRKKASGSDLDDPSPIVNVALSTIIRTERYLPVFRLPGVSLLVTARAS